MFLSERTLVTIAVLIVVGVIVMATLIAATVVITAYRQRSDLRFPSFPQFLPRDAMYKRGLCRHAVSVCLSVMFVNFV